MDGAGGMLSTGVGPTKQGQISSVIVDMERKLEELLKAIADTEGVLTPILRQSPPPSTEAGEIEKEIALCPIASKIRTFARIVDTAIQQIKDIRDRVEI